MEELFASYEERERELLWKHRWVGLFYNYLIAGLTVALFASFIKWAIDIKIDRQASDRAAAALANYQAEQQAAAEEEAKAKELLARMDANQQIEEAKTVAKAIYGIRNFIDKYSYSNDDIETYVWCMLNRADYSGDDLEHVISAAGQFLGYSDSNPIVKDYYEIALRLVKEWHENEVRPVASDYVFAELDDDGVWLRNQYKADGYTRRWHA